MKWITAIYRNKITTIGSIVLFSIITYQCLRFNAFDIMTVVLLTMVVFVYFMYLCMWKYGMELIEEGKRVKKT